jgi:hypothetical protein
MAQTSRRLRVLTWHVHGTYLYYLTQADCDFLLPVNAERNAGYGGKLGSNSWGKNVIEIPVEDLKQTDFDLILFQSRQNYLHDQYEVLSAEQRQLPRVYLEHDPPREHPTDTRHIVDDPEVTLVHVTDFNQLMWDSGKVPSYVIHHGVVEPKARYEGTLERGIVVINNIQSRGRRLGYDIFETVRQHVPIDLIGIGAKEIGGVGEIPHKELPEFISQYRFFFNPIRYTSLGLAVIEAMFVGLPIMGLATTELVTVIKSGYNGYISLKPETLIEHMQDLLQSPAKAKQLGEAARATAKKRFSIERFAHDWETLFRQLVHREPVAINPHHIHKPN